MPAREPDYIPALSHACLTPLYYPLIRLTMPEVRFKRQLVKEAGIGRDERVLDLGCGTATLTLLIKKTHPDATIIGIDGDEDILHIGRKKIEKARINITLTRSMAFNLPYLNRSFDRILSSLMFHHLNRENKRQSLMEAYRVLRPGGSIHIADFGKPHNPLMRIAAYPWRLFDRSKRTADIVNGLLPGVQCFRVSALGEERHL